jgi:hypothetical protein
VEGEQTKTVVVPIVVGMIVVADTDTGIVYIVVPRAAAPFQPEPIDTRFLKEIGG